MTPTRGGNPSSVWPLGAAATQRLGEVRALRSPQGAEPGATERGAVDLTVAAYEPPGAPGRSTG